METESYANSLFSGVDTGEDFEISGCSAPEMRRVRRIQIPRFGQRRQPVREIKVGALA